jgi:cell division protein FtsQ
VTAPLPTNRRRESASAPPARKHGVLHAPGDPLPYDDSPAPGVASSSVRPPAATLPRRPRTRLLATLQLALGAIVVITASVAVAWGARRYLLTSPRFAVRTVEVEGMRRRTAAEVARGAGVEVGKNILALDLEATRGAIVADPWIESAKVTRKLPSTVHINVVEREARALVIIGSEPYLATRDGDLFKKVAPEDPFDLPVVTGVASEQVARDRAGVVLSVKRVLDVAEDLERAGVAKRWPIQEMSLERDGALVVTVGREAIALHLGRPPYREKLDQLRSVLAELARRKASASVVFLDNDAHPERVVVRMR